MKRSLCLLIVVVALVACSDAPAGYYDARETGACPTDHPYKQVVGEGGNRTLYQVPGDPWYDRLDAQWCTRWQPTGVMRDRRYLTQ